jgi:hypothetical protein
LLKAIEVLMPTNIPDAPREVLTGLDDTSTALQSVRNLLTGGRNTAALRTMFATANAEPTDNALSQARKSLPKPPTKLATFTPGT